MNRVGGMDRLHRLEVNPDRLDQLELNRNPMDPGVVGIEGYGFCFGIER